MFVKFVLAAATTLATAVLLAPAAHADTLDVQPAKKQHHHKAAYQADAGIGPSRGMSMAQVEKRFGAPVEKLPAAGGDKPRHPTINRWRYNGYTVYFERNRVIHSVPDAVAAAPAS
ncbi:hypothetical protein [Dokdonella soli]|uniref:Uncharacterized protein n=1 Tax=Dokdonella soli TaxID=529810 RepID=A0ABN1IDS3_9GAMM